MTLSGEMQILYYAAGVLLAANLLAMALFVLFAKLPDCRFRDTISNVILEIDKFADRMENEQKRRIAIQSINEVLGWRRILVPAALIGWVIDADVAAIRKMQAATGTPNLHERE
ncbi:hypothetical protein [Sporomusa sp.]|uniref:hypothetical protein n=1 Tax=Sporomusa sp. TaxID=2078658 RepID=UPI002CDC430D|nr:hypothetical protein [Sporomusa sp.]HWR45797.1 hypothetical protein [Sporomusa sp.]